MFTAMTVLPKIRFGVNCESIYTNNVGFFYNLQLSNTFVRRYNHIYLDIVYKPLLLRFVNISKYIVSYITHHCLGRL